MKKPYYGQLVKNYGQIGRIFRINEWNSTDKWYFDLARTADGKMVFEVNHRKFKFRINPRKRNE